MIETSDVVIIGGGVAGCASAYYLSLAGAKVTIIEREGISSQASGFSAGGLNPLEGSCIPGPLSALAMTSFKLHKELWGTLKNESSIDFQGRIISLTKVAFSEDEFPSLQESVSLFEDARDEGFSGEWLDRREILELEPRLSTRLIGGGQALRQRHAEQFVVHASPGRSCDETGSYRAFGNGTRC